MCWTLILLESLWAALSDSSSNITVFPFLLAYFRAFLDRLGPVTLSFSGKPHVRELLLITRTYILQKEIVVDVHEIRSSGSNPGGSDGHGGASRDSICYHRLRSVFGGGAIVTYRMSSIRSV